MRRTFLAVVWLAMVLPAMAEPASSRSKEKLQVFQDLIGSWRGTGTPSGTREERDRGFWRETISWQWQFKGKETWLLGEVEKGRHFTRFELRYRPDRDLYELKASTLDKQHLVFLGRFADKRLTAERLDEKTRLTHRLVFSLLHFNRHLYRGETRREGVTAFTQLYQVGATKEGVAFATEDRGNECIVSGGKGTMAVMHKGKTYYVCCSGCRDAFKEDPEKYIKEYEAAQKKKD